ncbi:ATP-dependent DNA helicase Q1 [Labeo rohita]|uniref:ATP-dependent DNA helicase Q1 n=1 Tax=Labeo rohita TaxID=84645 RepID=A0ABQ8MWV3_LABRO|nr:ATP-dependent DNA helicase Q1 [Labeo rohita]
MFNKAPHGKELFEDLRMRIVALHKDGLGYKRFSNNLKLSYSIVARFIQRLSKIGSIRNRPHKGQSMKLSACSVRHVQNLASKNRCMSAASIALEVAEVEGPLVSEDTFELHSVQLELGAVEKQIQELLERQTELRELWNPPGAGTPRTLGAAAAEDTSQAPAEDLAPSARNLRSPPRDGTRRCDCQRLHCPIPAIPKDGESIGVIVLHAGVNDIKLQQMEVLKRDFSSLIETVRSTSPAMKIIVSGLLPMYRHGHERLFRADGLHPSRNLASKNRCMSAASIALEVAEVEGPLVSEDTFELHSVQLELEAVEKQIQELLERQTELRELWNPPGAGTPRTLGAAAAEDTSQAPAEDLAPSARNRFAPLREMERDAVIVRDSIVRYVRATLAKGKVHTHCFPGARILYVSAQIPAIPKDGESIGVIVLHAGVNDIKLQQMEVLKRDFSSLIETVRSTSPAMKIIVSGLLPMYRHGHERFSFSVPMACTPAELERNCCRATSPGRYAPFD